ncbi:MAG: right-handed parallel beta-helix repeat-containing protein [Nanoarchaeota archaeon]|nr:right-handed parallel beta-helix repeat-containing protein [Nanoarchaeota archaeon]
MVCKVWILLIGLILLPVSIAYTGCNDPELNVGELTCREVETCGLLNWPNSYYLLNNDVSSENTCLVLAGAHNSVLDLNEHTITYNTLALDLHNWNFEEPFGSDNWVIDHPGNVERVYAPNEELDDYLWDDYFIRITSAQPTTLRSNLIHIPNADQTYIAWMIPHGPYHDPPSIFIEVEREDGVTLCRTEHGNFERAPGIKCEFQASAPINVYVKIGTLISDPQYTVNMDFIGFASAFDQGILIRPYSDYLRAPDNPEVSRSDNVKIFNGFVIQGDGRGPYGTGLELVSDDLEINNVLSSVNGINTENVMIQSAEAEVYNNTLISSSPYVFNRMSITAQLKVHYACDGISIHDNFIIGGPQRGIEVGGADNVEVFNNWVHQNSTVTNNHGLGAYGGYNISFVNNTVHPIHGRGISFEADPYHPFVSGYIINNSVIVYERPPSEYYHNFDFTCAHGIKLENNIEDVTVMGNIVDSSTGPLTWGGCPLNIGVDENSRNITVQNNTFISEYREGSESESFASAFLAYGDHSELLIEGNDFYSNHLFYYTSATIDPGPLIQSNTFTRTYPERKPFHTILFEGWHQHFVETRFLNTTLEGAEYTDLYINGQSGVYEYDYSVGWFLDVVALGSGQPLQNANIQIHDAYSDLVFTGTTNEEGRVQTDLTEFELSGYANTFEEILMYSPFRVTATYGADEQYEIVEMDESKELIFQFGDTCPVPYDYPPCGCMTTEEVTNAIVAWFAGGISFSNIIDGLEIFKDGPGC